MTVGSSPPGGVASNEAADVVVVDVGPRGLRARRTGTHPPITLDAPDQALGPHTPRAPGVRDVLASIAALTGDGSSPAATATRPDAVVVSVPDAALAFDAPGLLTAVAAAFGDPVTAVVDSCVSMVAGAFGALTPAVVLEMGVGVRVLATDFDEVWHRVDGWGPLLGDRGSAAWLGTQGLAAGLRHRDGLTDGSAALLDAARRQFGDEHGWAGLLDRPGAAGVLADFASTVGDLARTDAVAEGICRLAGEHLADSLCAAARVLPGAPEAATGGLLLIDTVKVAFASALARRHVFLMPAVGDCLAGAHALADHLAGGGTLPHRPPYVFTSGRPALGA